jgi:hypothetical protein
MLLAKNIAVQSMVNNCCSPIVLLFCDLNGQWKTYWKLDESAIKKELSGKTLRPLLKGLIMVLEHCYSLSSVYENAFTCRVKVVKYAIMLLIIVLVIFIPISFFLFSIF